MNDIFVADYAITAQNNYSPIPTSVGQTAAKAPGVTAVGSVRTGDSLVFGERQFTTAVTPGAPDVISLKWKDGSQADDGEPRRRRRVRRRRLREGPQPDGRLVRSRDLHHREARRTFEVKGIFDPPTGGSPFGPVTDLGRDVGSPRTRSPQDLYTFVRIAGGESRRERGRAREDALGLPEREGPDAAAVHRQPDLRA